jgi:GNAT superfamily N-acetyltransferase
MKLEALSEKNLGEFRSLLGSKDFGGCFCAVWTSHSSDWEQRCGDPTQPNFFRTEKDLAAGRHIGFLVYQGAELVGWTGSGPKTEFPFLQTKLGSRLTPFTREIWSIGCLAVAERFRGQGIAQKIVGAVLAKARDAGALSVEAYPVRPFHEPRSYRGACGLFQRAGFKEVAVEKDGEHELLVMSCEL